MSLDSPWNFPNMPDEIYIHGSSTEVNAVNGINYCNMVDVVDNVVNESIDETIDSVSGIQETETAIFVPDDCSVEDLLSINDSTIVQMQQDTNKNDKQDHS